MKLIDFGLSDFITPGFCCWLVLVEYSVLVHWMPFLSEERTLRHEKAYPFGYKLQLFLLMFSLLLSIIFIAFESMLPINNGRIHDPYMPHATSVSGNIVATLGLLY